jgi:hypothetical protein
MKNMRWRHWGKRLATTPEELIATV